MVSLQERRGYRECEICENGVLRLSIAQEAGAQVLQLDARDAFERWVPLLTCTPNDDLVLRDAHRQEWGAVIHTFEPVQMGDGARGVALRGHVGETALELTLLLADAGSWCRQWVELSGALPPEAELALRWHFIGGLAAPRLRWPKSPVSGAGLLRAPAAFAQEEACFAALVPDPEVGGAGQLGHLPGDEGGLEYVVTLPTDGGESFALSATLCLDGRSLPWRGFQHVVRRLARHLLPASLHQPAREAEGGPLPLLPELGPCVAWRPFLQESRPADIAAYLRHLLNVAADGDWYVLDEALCWLDRLCLHQCVRALPGGPPVGAFGDGPEWEPIAPWLPALLLEAFRLSGIEEYAARARAALAALPAEPAARVFAYLYPRYGDLCVLPDLEEVLALTDLGLVLPCFNDRRIELSLSPTTRPLRVVVDGRADRYALAINHTSLGELPTTLLRRGLDVPAEVLRG